MSDTWQQFDYFPSSVYFLEKPEFLKNVKTIAYKYLENIKKETKLNDIYPMYHTYNFAHENSILDFTSYIANTGWNILNTQGFDMNNKETYFIMMWLQYHHKYSSMEQHVHPFGSKIIGFYILEAPENCSELVLHDPRPGKIQDGFGDNMTCQIEHSTDRVYFKVEPGMLIFTNSWLPHSFTRNASNEPFSFIHFNLGIRDHYTSLPPPAEVI